MKYKDTVGVVYDREFFLKLTKYARSQTAPTALAAALLLCASVFPTVLTAQTQTPSAVFKQYCVTCHNERLKTGGFVLDPSELDNVSAKPEIWEKVIRKLRSESMPPASSPRPSPATYDAVASFLESELDRAAAAKPNPGSLPLLHRLTRTEYRNAVRDLLALDALPKEMDISLLLPADNVSSGFDNIADLLFVSPPTMERYLDAARKIGRLAVGDPEMPVMVNIHRLDPEHWQEARVEELSFGTRGGLAIQGYFPLDADYNFKVDTAGAAREAHQIEITIDGERMQLIAIGGNTGGGGAGGRGRGGAQRPMDYRIPVKAGSHLVGVTFIERNQARDEETLKPRIRSRGGLPAVASVTISGPYNVKGPGDTPSRRRIFTCKPKGSADEPACAKNILSTLTRRAYRRPSTDADVQRLMPFFTAGKAEGGFDRGIQKALERVLVSPQFMFRIETEPANVARGTAYRVSDLELASRLSFFIWSSIPDDELLDAAIAGRLKSPQTLEQQVRRMIADPRSESMVTNFAAQWLYLRDIEAKEPDEILYPNWDETLRHALQRETELFLDSILRENRGVLELLTANYTFVNERLAKHYGIPNVIGSSFRRVTLPQGSPRGGLLGQGSILAITSYANRTSPVLRGKWILENLLAAAPPPPPPNIPALTTNGTEPGQKLTLKEAMIAHRASPSCASCHARMDPIGFAMENFDAIGKWRERDADKAIESGDGIPGLKKMLMEHSKEFVGAVTEKLLMYAVGRNLQYYDAPAVREIVRSAAPSNHTFSSLVLGVVKSVPFQMRRSAL